MFYNRFEENILYKLSWWYVFAVCEIELILMSLPSYQFNAFIQQIFCRENHVIFLCKA